jgi:hypothetical protein
MTTTTTTTTTRRGRKIRMTMPWRDVCALGEINAGWTGRREKFAPRHTSRPIIDHALANRRTILGGPQRPTLEPVAIMRPVFHRLYCDYHAHIRGWYTTDARQREALPPLVRPVRALLWFSVRHVGNELIIVITHVVTCTYMCTHVCTHA